MSFGYVLKKFRNDRNLTLRELGKLCEIDHAYIHCLETGKKNAPSNKVIKSFISTLKLSPRKEKLLKFFIKNKVNNQLIDVFIEDEDRPLKLLELLSQINLKCSPKTSAHWRKKADQLNIFLNK